MMPTPLRFSYYSTRATRRRARFQALGTLAGGVAVAGLGYLLISAAQFALQGVTL